jgi:5'-3' exonuclease
MHVHLLDGTYELFRHHAVVPAWRSPDGVEMAAVRAVTGSVMTMLEAGATHVGVATDHVIESFRNDMWPGYKTGEHVPPELRAQFQPLEESLRLLGVTVWAMVEFEADDAMASAAMWAAADPRVEQVVIATPDKDLAQCVSDDRVVQLERRTGRTLDAAGVIEKFGVPPASIPDYLALVGDSADGFPGLPGGGAKSAATVLARYRHIEAIPDDPSAWEVTVRSAARLADALVAGRADARLFRDLATLRVDVPVFDDVDDLCWRGPQPGFADWCARMDVTRLAERADALAHERSG